MCFFDIVNVVRRHQLQTEIFGPGNQVPIDFGLLRQVVVLQFEIKVFRAERLLEPINRLASARQIILLNQLRNFAGQAAGQRDQSLLVRRQSFLIEARFVVKAFQMRVGHEFDQVLVADLIFGQQHEVVINVPAAAGGFLFQPASWCDINFAANDRLDALGARALIKLNRAIKDSVIGERQGWQP